MIEPDFKELLNEAGLPTDEAGITAKFNEELTASGSIYSNPVNISPFKRLFTALIVTPVLWLINALIVSWMPQSFLLTASGVWLEVIAWAFGIERKQAIKTRGNITFVREDTSGDLVIPAGTMIPSVAINGRVYQLAVIDETTMPDGTGTINVLCEATEPGSAWNLAEGFYSIVPGSLPTITSVNNLANWLVQPGSDTETDADLRERVRNLFVAINQWHIDAVYRSIISAFDGVSASNIIFDNDAPRGPGTCNAYIFLETGNPSEEFLQTITDKIMVEGNHGHGDDVLALALPETEHDITATAWAVPGTSVDDALTLLANIRSFIRCAFRENGVYTCTKTRPMAKFSFSVLIKELHLQFPQLESIDFETTDIISGVAIPRIDTLTVEAGEA